MKRMIWAGSFGKSFILPALITVLLAPKLVSAAPSVIDREPTEEAIEAHVKVSPGVEYHNVSPYIYGQFIEHVGGCIYDGIWVREDSEIENAGGIRLDTVRALKKIEVPIVRWPGGLFADNYHWRGGGVLSGSMTRKPVHLETI
ncbi:MAG: hypothetical protein ACYS21_14275 [Planctomycetota bacterium]|jgi:hypothetical protein